MTPAEQHDAAPRLRHRKRHGVHYTPPALARFLAEAITAHWPAPSPPAVQRPSAGQQPVPRLVRVLDPACGDGALLLALAESLPPELRAQLLLTGCETDAQAVRRAEQTLRSCGAAQVSLRHADFLAGDAIPPADPTARDATARNATASDPATDDRQAFDVVIANPPYVRTQVLGARQAQSLALRFDLSGRVDLYQAFVRAMAGVLRPGGLLGLLTSNRFLTVKSGAALRRLLRSEFDVRSVCDLGDTKLFSAAVLPVVVVARRRDTDTPRPGPGTFDRIYELRNGERQNGERKIGETRHGEMAARLPVIRDVLAALADRRTSGVIATCDGTFQIERGELAATADLADVWRLTHAAHETWLATVRSHQDRTFGDVAEIRVGIKTTADSVFVRSDWNGLPADKRPEPELLRPLLTHREAGRWTIAEPGPTRQVLYPHVVRNGRREPIRLQDYPRAANYLRSHEERLRQRSYVVRSGREWFEIWVPHDPDAWAAPKIVFPDIAESPRFCLDRSGAVVQGDCYWITLKPGVDAGWLPLMLAVANSTFATAFYDLSFHNKLYAGRRRFMTQYVRQFPLPSLGSRPAKEILALTGRLVDRSPTADKAERRLDELVKQAFGLAK